MSGCAYPIISTAFTWDRSDTGGEARSRYDLDPDVHRVSLLAQQTLRLLKGRAAGRALDIGAGEGADAIRLAKLGYDVDAVEVSTVGAKKIECFAEESRRHWQGASVGLRCSGLSARMPYDVIICNGVLHYVEDKQSVIDLMQQATSSGRNQRHLFLE